MKSKLIGHKLQRNGVYLVNACIDGANRLGFLLPDSIDGDFAEMRFPCIPNQIISINQIVNIF
jgi:hypothetical protein